VPRQTLQSKIAGLGINRFQFMVVKLRIPEKKIYSKLPVAPWKNRTEPA
jgi:hypothetical protein